MSAAGYSQDSQLGLTQAELIILRQEREIVAAQEASRQGQSQSRNERSTMADPRGRGTGRTSQASSTRGNSAASSSAARRVRLDSTSLSRIQNALENFMRQLTSRIEQVRFTIFNSASVLIPFIAGGSNVFSSTTKRHESSHDRCRG